MTKKSAFNRRLSIRSLLLFDLLLGSLKGGFCAKFACVVTGNEFDLAISQLASMKAERGIEAQMLASAITTCRRGREVA
jgi:hypothetical protein